MHYNLYKKYYKIIKKYKNIIMIRCMKKIFFYPN